jgi:penicillin-binding protein 2
MDTDTGAVYAMISYPGFDPNLFAHGIGMEDWQALLSDPAAPLTNKATGGLYPPGSTFKMVSALAGLKKGVMTEATAIHCPGYMDVGDHRFHCWRRGGHGKMNLVDAITQSCDVYFYQLAREIGIDQIADMAGRLGLGQVYDGKIPGQKAGLIPNRKWKRGRFGTPWQPGETIIASIGQGYVQSTPLQLAVMTARLVNGGHGVTPTLIRGFGPADGLGAPSDDAPGLNIDPYHRHLINRGMNGVTGHPRGTAHAYQIDEENMAMGGKTGTSQVRRISAEERVEGVREQDDLPWKLRNHALFVGYAPVDRPKYVASVIVEHGGSGALTAAPIARDLLKLTQERRPDRFS